VYDAHPAIASPMRVRIDYARVVASVATIDQGLDPQEIASLRRLCGALGLPPGATEGVVLFAQAPQADKVRESVEALRDTDLRLTVITDVVALAMADGKYHIAERKQIHALAALLLVSEPEVAAIEDYVSRSLNADENTEGRIVTDLDHVDESAVVAYGGEIAASLAAACVPLAMVWLYSPRGLSITGVSAALTRLGFGFGPLAGVAIDVGLGLCAYAAVRLLFQFAVGGGAHDDDDDA
jgi:uncharacterized tellurite resistance protein B-like protein